MGAVLQAEAVLQAVANPNRRRILRLVWEDEMSSREIAAHFDVSWPAVSQNLRVLREAGLVRERRDGNRRLYRADPEPLGPLGAMLQDMWKSDLARLQVVAEREQRGTRR